MSWWVKDYIAVSEDETQQLCNIQADAVSDLPSQDQTETAGFIFVRGSKAYVLDTSGQYIMNSQGQWVLQKSEHEIEISADDIVYDNTQSGLTATTVQDAIDDLKDTDDMQDRSISDLSDETDRLQASIDQITGLEKQMQSGEDLNTYVDPGVFQILSTSVAQTIVNIPSNCKVAGSIEVKRLNGSGRIQFYYPNWASPGSNPGSFYFRQRTGATNWSSWYYFSGTVVPNASLQSLNSPMALNLSRDDLNLTQEEGEEDA